MGEAQQLEAMSRKIVESLCRPGEQIPYELNRGAPMYAELHPTIDGVEYSVKISVKKPVSKGGKQWIPGAIGSR
jgi:hypothetical protein